MSRTKGKVDVISADFSGGDLAELRRRWVQEGDGAIGATHGSMNLDSLRDSLGSANGNSLGNTARSLGDTARSFGKTGGSRT